MDAAPRTTPEQAARRLTVQLEAARRRRRAEAKAVRGRVVRS